MDALLQTNEPNHTAAPSPSLLREGMAFLSENPEAFGLISDAYPIVADEWMIAASGSDTDAGVLSRSFSGVDGIDTLYDTVFENVLPRSPLTAETLAGTLGTGGQGYSISRCAAVLSEAVAAHLLAGMPAEVTHSELSRRLGGAILRALAGLRDNFNREGVSEQDADLYTVSLAVCRIRHAGAGHHVLDLLIAGDYRAYLLDKDGLRPLRLPPSDGISPDGTPAPLTGRRVDLYHPDPFALLLLSGSACTVNAAEQQSLRSNPGLAWRYRMRLEANILRVVTSLSGDSDFGARAGQFFTGRACGRDSASGAMLLRRGDVPFSAFRADCLSRLRHVEDMIALLPDGYDPTRIPALPSRVENEHNYIQRLLSQEPGLLERTTEALRILALEKLSYPSDEVPPLPEDVPELRRLSAEDIAEVYRVYDAENDEDYAHIDKNRDVMRERLSSHWVTLRPILMQACDRDGEEPSDDDIVYASLLRLNARLSKHYNERNGRMAEVARKLEKHAATLRAEGEDWLHGRGDDSRAALWADTAAADLSAALRGFADTYERTEDEYRSLLATYTDERARLFERDTEQADGFFAEDWESILHGRLSDEQAGVCRAAIADATEGNFYTQLWDDVCMISRGTGARICRVQDRSADRRTVRAISERTEFRVAAVRASAYRDPDWGEAVCELLDTPHRASYFTMVRRWQETCELMARQAAAYEEYRKLYEDDAILS